MINQIAEITGVPVVASDAIITSIIDRIRSKLPADMTPEHPGFHGAVIRAEAQVNAESAFAISTLVKQIVAPPPEKVFKIKPVLKGKRIAEPAPSGVRYSFGPVWMEAVNGCRGIALKEYNRAKLNHQAVLLGIVGAEEMEVRVLCRMVAEAAALQNAEEVEVA